MNHNRQFTTRHVPALPPHGQRRRRQGRLHQHPPVHLRQRRPRAHPRNRTAGRPEPQRRTVNGHVRRGGRHPHREPPPRPQGRHGQRFAGPPLPRPHHPRPLRRHRRGDRQHQHRHQDRRLVPQDRRYDRGRLPLGRRG